MNNNQFREGEHIVYQNGDSFEIGKIKRITKDGAFVYYTSGDTAAKTPFDCMHKLVNEYTINLTSLGGSCWISVDEALPQPKFAREWYLVSLKSGCVKTLAFEKTDQRWNWESTGSPVTHWMPLPLPPLEG